MDLNFNKVTYDGDLDDLSEDELRQTVEEFEAAQESNVAEFETATEALEEANEIDDSTIEDFEEARQGLIDDITGAEDFDDVPLTEDKLEEEDFTDLQDWKTFVLGDEGDEGDETDDPEDEGNFDDFGKESPIQDDDDAEDFVEDELGQIQGLNL